MKAPSDFVFLNTCLCRFCFWSTFSEGRTLRNTDPKVLADVWESSKYWYLFVYIERDSVALTDLTLALKTRLALNSKISSWLCAGITGIHPHSLMQPNKCLFFSLFIQFRSHCGSVLCYIMVMAWLVWNNKYLINRNPFKKKHRITVWASSDRCEQNVMV